LSTDIEWKELDDATRKWAVSSQWENDMENYGGSWVTTIEDANDGTGDGILTFPPELVLLRGWTEGTLLNLEVQERENGNVLIITEKTNESN
jgi:hypothetical protein